MCSDAPDPDPLIGEAAKDNIALSKEMLDYYKAKDKANEPRQQRMDDLTEDLVKQQMSTSAFNDTQARATWERYQATGIPAEDKMYEDAANYDTQAARDKAAGEAATDVEVSMAAANDARRRNMARAGVNPADGRSLSMEQDAATNTALAKAGAMNTGRQRVQDMGIMLRKDAAAFARGMPSSAAQTFGVAATAGGQASGAAAAGMATANANTGTMGAGYSNAVGANNAGASILQQQYNSGISAANGANGNMAGLAGTAATVGIAI